MKLKLGLFLLLLPLCMLAQKNEKEYTNFYIGPIIGGSINNVTFAGAESLIGSRTFKGLDFGLLGGVDTRWQINDYVALLVQPRFIGKGYYNKYKTREQFPTIYYNSGNMQYFNLPVLVRGRFGNDLFSIYGEFGGTYGYLFDGTSTTAILNPDGTYGKETQAGFSNKNKGENPFSVAKHEFGLEYGLGMEFHNEKFILSMGASYLHTMTDFINNETLEELVDNYDARNKSYTFHVSYVFKIPKFQGNVKGY